MKNTFQYENEILKVNLKIDQDEGATSFTDQDKRVFENAISRCC